MILIYDFGNGDYEFEPSYEETRDALKEILSNMSKEELIQAILDNECEDYFEEDLWNYFENVARGDYEENLDYQRDPYKYYGLNEGDFH